MEDNNDLIGNKLTIKERQDFFIKKYYLSKQEFKFFHPFFVLMIHKYKFITLNSLYINNEICTCSFSINKVDEKGLFPIFLTICDEMCGILSFKNYKTVSFTTEINVTEGNFSCISSNEQFPKEFLIETMIDNKASLKSKIKINFKIMDSKLINIFEGYSFFKSAKLSLPNSKF